MAKNNSISISGYLDGGGSQHSGRSWLVCILYKAGYDPDPGLYRAFDFGQIAIKCSHKTCICSLDTEVPGL